MKAIRVHAYGDASVLRYEDAPRPEAKAGEVLVRVRAAGVNPLDSKVRAGLMQKHLPLQLPWIPGVDFSGTVEQLGEGVSDLAVGDQVFGKTDLPHDGSYAEYVAVARSGVAPKPKTIDFALAAAVPLAALTAWQGLFGNDGGPSLDLAAGQTILILGAAGGIGTFAIQLAKWKGARVVAWDRSAIDSRLLGLGADVVVDTKAQGMDAVGEVDAVLDLVGGELQTAAWKHVKRGGSFASTVGKPSDLEAKNRGVLAIAVSTRTNAVQLQAIAKLIDAGSVEVPVYETLPLESAKEAHEMLEKGGVQGKLVLAVAGA